MSQGNASDLPSSSAHDPAESDDKYLVRNPRQIRQLLQELNRQRSVITAHLAGRDQSFATALLDVGEDEDWMLLDGSSNEASNRAAGQASHLLCFAQLSQVRVRFRVAQLERLDREGHVAFRAPLPETLHHVQRRESYRLETPVTHSPACTLYVAGEEGEPHRFEARVADISAGGMAITLPPGMPDLGLRQTYRDCWLALPDQPPISVSLLVCSQSRRAMPNGMEYTRAGLQFVDLPRGADEAIQRYIFRVDRQRSARRNGAS